MADTIGPGPGRAWLLAVAEPKPLSDATHREIASLLRRSGNRYTSGRRALVETVAARGRPATLPELLADDDRLSPSSAYRNLDVLERSGVVRRLATGSDFAHFELAESLVGHHHHLICVSCGRVDDIELGVELESVLDRELAAAAQALSFKPQHHILDLYGHCRDCA